MFHIEINCESWTSGTGISTHTQEWIRVDTTGNPMRKKEDWSQEVLQSFKAYELAKEYLDVILEFGENETQVVFDTDNPEK